jgi:hypothetical protein
MSRFEGPLAIVGKVAVDQPTNQPTKAFKRTAEFECYSKPSVL